MRKTKRPPILGIVAPGPRPTLAAALAVAVTLSALYLGALGVWQLFSAIF
jgi:hypothetical protein